MPARAVVVDDDAASASAIAKLLARAGCEASSCTDAEQAVAMALAHDVDLVSLDITMPGLDGYEVLSLIRSHEHSRRGPNVPVITVTGKVTAADRAHALAAGFAAHLAKPLLLADLRQALARADALRGELARTRYSVDRAAIEARLGQMLAGRPGPRLDSVAGLALALEQQCSALLRQCLQDAYDGHPQRATGGIERLSAIADSIGASRLSTLCRRLVAAIPDGTEAFETAAVLARAELDRVVYTLREQALA